MQTASAAQRARQSAASVSHISSYAPEPPLTLLSERQPPARPSGMYHCVAAIARAPQQRASARRMSISLRSETETGARRRDAIVAQKEFCARISFPRSARSCSFSVPNPGRKRGQQQRGKGRGARGRADAGPRLVDKNALSARGSGPSRQSRSPSPDSPPAKRAASADSSGYETDTPDEVQQEAVRRVCGALGMREQFEAAMAAGELLEMLESLPRGAVEASVRLMRGYNRTGEWPEPILTSPTPQRGRSPSPVDEWSDG